MTPLTDAIRLLLAPVAPLFARRGWCHAPWLRLGASLAPGACTVKAALLVMGLAMEHRFTNDHRVLNRATESALHASRMLLGGLVAHLVPLGAPIVLGAEDTLERRSGRQITATGCYCDAVRSTKQHVIRCFGFQGVVMRLLVAVSWVQRVRALPCLPALGRPAEQTMPRRHKIRVDGVRHMIRHVRRWLPERQLVLVVDGGCAAVSLALACVKRQVAMVSRLYYPHGP
jgi:hypothetical protein